MRDARITKRLVDGLQAKERQYWVWDSKLTGFGVAVRPSGVHSFVFSYRNQKNQKKNITIAKVRDLTPEQARKRAERYRFEVSEGFDPLEERASRKAALTLGELLDIYQKSDAFQQKAASTKSTDFGRMENYIRPLLGSEPVDSLDLRKLELAHRKVVAGQTLMTKGTQHITDRSRVRGGKGTARKTFRLLRAILNWGNARLLVDDSQTTLVAKLDLGRDETRTAILDDSDAYRELFRALDRLTSPDQIKPNESPISNAAADAIRVIALTGARKGEISSLQWKHVKFEKGLAILPPSSHKSGSKTGQSRIIGLPGMAIDIICRQPKGDADDYVFCTSDPKQRIDLSKPWRRVRDAAGLSSDVVLHSLRHSIASHMAMNGSTAPEIMTALGHKDMATSQKYIHFAENRHKKIADGAASHIVSAISGKLRAKDE